MILSNNYFAGQTAIFIAILGAAIFISARRKTVSAPLPKEVSNELRGLAILGVIFAHLTYGQFYGTDFLFPLGIWGGVAVNLFFFLSGYGLAASAIYRPKPFRQFYKKRIVKIYWPLWLSLVLVLGLDAWLLNRFYPLKEIVFSFAGFFPTANLWTSLNSPLWFLTPLIFYYLLFPVVFRPRHPRLSVALIAAISFLALWPGWPVSEQVLKFYQTHFLAFPLGVLSAVFLVSSREICQSCSRRDRCWPWLAARKFRSWLERAKERKPLAEFLLYLKSWPNYGRLGLIIILAAAAIYTAYYSGVGQGIWREQLFALFTMLCLALIFILKKTKFVLLEIFGVYSFEIYLLHWPLISRYSEWLEFLPPASLTVLWLAGLLLLGWLFGRLVDLPLLQSKNKKSS
ncbi:MAG: acyltransferase [Candidatus Buchananbacteria bacterium]